MSTRDIVGHRSLTPSHEIAVEEDALDPATGYRVRAYAVVIGINRYADQQIRQLRYARADAEAFHAVLTDVNLGRFNPANTTLLVDESATQRSIKSAIGTWLRDRTSPDDTVVLYFAGHGAPEIDASADIDTRPKSEDGIEKYLIPHDADLNDLFATAISMEDVARLIRRIAAKQVVVFLDCCYSGTAGGRTFSRPDVQTRSVLSREFLDHIGSEGRCVITACDVNEVALEMPDLGHGVFTHYLLKGLRGEADKDRTGVVAVEGLYKYVYDAVSAEARKRRGSMRPVWKGELRGRVLLTQYETPAARQAKVLHAAAETAYAEGRVDEAENTWKQVLGLDPTHASARARLEEIVAQRVQRQRAIEARLAKLRQLFDAGGLSPETFARLVEIAEPPAASLSATDLKLRQLIEALVDGGLTDTSFSKSVALVMGAPAPAPVSKDPAGVAVTDALRSLVAERREAPPHADLMKRLMIGGGALIALAVATSATTVHVPSTEMSADLRVERLSLDLSSSAYLARKGELLRARRLDIAGLGDIDSVLVAPGRDKKTLLLGVRLSDGGNGQLGLDLAQPLPARTRLTLRRTPAPGEYHLAIERSNGPIMLNVAGSIQIASSTGPPDIVPFAAPTPAAVYPDSVGPLDLTAVLPSEDTVVLARQLPVAHLSVRQSDPRFAADTVASTGSSSILGGTIQVGAPGGPSYELKREAVLNWSPVGKPVIDEVVLDGGQVRVRFRARVDTLELGTRDDMRNIVPRVFDRIGGTRIIPVVGSLATAIVFLTWFGVRGRGAVQ